MTQPPPTPKPIVTDAEALRFIERAFRNIDLPPLSKDDLRDIADALAALRPNPDASEIMREALEQQRNRWLSLSADENERPGLRNYANASMDLIDEALSSEKSA
jgi:hypothetical protein